MPIFGTPVLKLSFSNRSVTLTDQIDSRGFRENHSVLWNGNPVYQPRIEASQAFVVNPLNFFTDQTDERSFRSSNYLYYNPNSTVVPVVSLPPVPPPVTVEISKKNVQYWV